MDSLTTIFLRRLPLGNIDTFKKVFVEVITFTKQANPNGGGMMLPTQVVMKIPTYPMGAPTILSQFIPMNLFLLQ